MNAIIRNQFDACLPVASFNISLDDMRVRGAIKSVHTRVDAIIIICANQQTFYVIPSVAGKRGKKSVFSHFK